MAIFPNGFPVPAHKKMPLIAVKASKTTLANTVGFPTHARKGSLAFFGIHLNTRVLVIMGQVFQILEENKEWQDDKNFNGNSA